MNTETRYADGPGTLWSAHARWLLLAADPGAELADRLWEALHCEGPVVDDVLELLEKHYLGAVPALALLDLTPGAIETSSRGTGRIVHDGDSRVLTVGDPTSAPTRLLLGGVVSAAAALIKQPPALPTARDRRPPMIDGIPEHILASQSQSQSQPQSQSPPPRPSQSQPDHDGDTRSRPAHRARSRQQTGQTVLAVTCAHRHLSAPYSSHCRVCKQPVPIQEPRRVPRPRLGVLALPSGERVPLDRGVVFGRQPTPVPGGENHPHLVHLPAASTYLSRMHVQIELEGWLVIARDLGSQGGTRLLVPDRPAELIRPHEAYTLEPGYRLDLADGYPISFDRDGGSP